MYVCIRPEILTDLLHVSMYRMLERDREKERHKIYQAENHRIPQNKIANLHTILINLLEIIHSFFSIEVTTSVAR